jgi:hypothetical protein
MSYNSNEEESKAAGMGDVFKKTNPEEEDKDLSGGEAPSTAPSTIGSSPSQPNTVKAMPKQQKAGTGTFANLRSYLQAAQGGGQQRVAQAATQKVQKLGAGAQKGIQQAQDVFSKRMEAGSLANMRTAQQEASDIVKAARGVTYQAPPQQQPTVQTQSAEATATEQPAPAPQPTQPQQYFTPEQQQRFVEIINARYQGPESLQQAGLYEQAAKKARTAQEAAQLTQTAGGREQLLRDVFGRSRDYSRGASKLDTVLLNTSNEGIRQLQEQARPALTSQQALQEAQNTTANLASQRAEAIEKVRAGAKDLFTKERTAEEQATQNRLNKITTEPAIQKDSSGNPVLDENGNPKYIQKIDTAGKPVVDAEGKPVYATEWELLSQQFLKNLAGNKDLNKTVLNEFNMYNKAIQNQQNIVDNIKRDIQNERHVKKLDQLYYTLAREEGKLKPLLKQKQDYLNKMSGQFILSPEESKFLNIEQGKALFNVDPEAIRSSQYDYSKLISKDELSRQIALQKLAELDTSRELRKDLPIMSDLEKAGTQDLSKSLDVENLLGYSKSSDFIPETSMSPELLARSEALQQLLRRQG